MFLHTWHHQGPHKPSSCITFITFNVELLPVSVFVFQDLTILLLEVLLCCLVCQAHRGGPRLGSYSVDRQPQALKGAPLVGFYSVVQRISHLKEHHGWGPTL